MQKIDMNYLVKYNYFTDLYINIKSAGKFKNIN